MADDRPLNSVSSLWGSIDTKERNKITVYNERYEGNKQGVGIHRGWRQGTALERVDGAGLFEKVTNEKDKSSP